MSIQDIIRAWKDEDYRLSLSEAERALLPEHPAGLIELTGAELDGVGGGIHPDSNGTCGTAACSKGCPDAALFPPAFHIMRNP
jgi:mersacidin/lichenicidin family type 2 lantibiotic